MRLQQNFFQRDTQQVAQQLIGKKLVKYTDYFGKYFKLSGLIIETEAYGYYNDAASHAYKGITKRNKPMFGPAGHAYIYYIYGNHFCFNIVAKKENVLAGAVLIRSLEPLEGVNIMRIYRRKDSITELTSGPGKLTQSLRISGKFNNINLTDNNNNNYLYVEEIKENECKEYKINKTVRIGISKSVEKKWRFIMLNKEPQKNQYSPNKFLSKRS